MPPQETAASFKPKSMLGQRARSIYNKALARRGCEMDIRDLESRHFQITSTQQRTRDETHVVPGVC